MPFLTNELDVIVLSNPLDPSQYDKLAIPFERLTIEEMLVNVNTEVAVAVNGAILPAEQYSSYMPFPGDTIHVAVLPGGGGGGNNTGKMALRIVAIAVLSYFTLGAGGAAAGGIFGTSTAGFIAATATFIGGTLLINKVMPIDEESGGFGDEKASYGIDGPKNTSLEGISVPVCYGRHGMGGNIIASRTEMLGDTQYLYMLINAGEGKIGGISDIKINGREVDEYENVEYEIRLGENEQAQVTDFGDTYRSYNVSRAINGPAAKDDPAQIEVFTTFDEVDKIRLDLVFPEGLYRTNSDGEISDFGADMQIYLRLEGENEWRHFTTYSQVDIRPADEKYFVKEYRKTRGVKVPVYFKPTDFYDVERLVSEAGVGEIWGKSNEDDSLVHIGEYGTVGAVSDEVDPETQAVSFRNSTAGVYRRQLYSRDLERGVYEVKIERATAGWNQEEHSNLTLVDIVEITRGELSYPNTALLAMRMKVDDQISSMPTITFVNHGRVIPVYDRQSKTWVEDASSNAAWVALDMLQNERYGANTSLSRIDLYAWSEWADYCDEKGLMFNGIFEATNETIWDAMKKVFKIGRASPSSVGLKHSVSVMRPKSPTMMFNSTNILKGSLRLNWLSTVDRANEVDVTFYDKDDDYKRRTIRVSDQAAIDLLNEEPRTTEITLLGCDNEEQAYREGVLALNFNKLLQTASWDSHIESLACARGDVVLLQHDLPAWGVGGKTKAGSTSRLINLDRPVVLNDQKQNAIVLHVSRELKFTGLVNNIVGNTLILTLSEEAKSQRGVTAITVGGAEARILEHDLQSNWVTVDSTDGMAAGDVVEGHQADATISRKLKYASGQLTSVELDDAEPSLANAPAAYVNFAVGTSELAAKPFMITDITGDDFHKRTLTGIEYSEETYDDDFAGELPNYSARKPDDVPHVIDLTLTELAVQRSGQFDYYLQAAWNHTPDALSNVADVYLSITKSGEPVRYKLINERNRLGRFSFVVKKGDVVDVKVIARSTLSNNAANEHTAPTAHFEVTGSSARAPNMPSGLAVREVGGNFVDLTWGLPVIMLDGQDPVYDQSIHLYEIFSAVVEVPEDYEGEILALAPNWDSGAYVKVGETQEVSFSHKGLEVDKAYFYYVFTANLFDPTIRSDAAPSGVSAPPVGAQTLAGALGSEVDYGNLSDILRADIDFSTWLSERLVMGGIPEDSSLIEMLKNRDKKFEEIAGSLISQAHEMQLIREHVESKTNTTAARIGSQVRTLAGNTGALAERIETVEAEFRPVDGKFTAFAKVEEAVRVWVDNESAIAEKTEVLTAELFPDGSSNPSAIAKVSDATRAWVEGESSLAQKTTALLSEVYPDGESEPSAMANLEQRISTLADPDGSIVISEEDLQATYNGTTASLSQVMSAILAHNQDPLAVWKASATVNDLTGSFGLINDGQSTTFAVDATNFVFFDSSSGSLDLQRPFEIIDGKTVIKSAVIESAVIEALDAVVISTNELYAGEKVALGDGKQGVAVEQSGHVEIGNAFSADGTGLSYDPDTGVLEIKGTLKNGTLEGVNGTFTGTVLADQIIGDLTKDYKLNISSISDISVGSFTKVEQGSNNFHQWKLLTFTIAADGTRDRDVSLTTDSIGQTTGYDGQTGQPFEYQTSGVLMFWTDAVTSSGWPDMYKAFGGATVTRATSHNGTAPANKMRSFIRVPKGESRTVTVTFCEKILAGNGFYCSDGADGRSIRAELLEFTAANPVSDPEEFTGLVSHQV